MVRAEENTASLPYRKEFTEPDYWHPKSENFVIINWEMFEAENPTIPNVLTMPQRDMRNTPSLGRFSTEESIKNRIDWFNRTEFKPSGEWAKPGVGKIDDESLALFRGILGRSPDSSKVPKPFRNRLFWMQNNHLPEDLVSFNRAAWRSAAKEGEEGRSVGLCSLFYDWTSSPNKGGYMLADKSKDVFANFQVSPDGKWIKMFVTIDLDDSVQHKGGFQKLDPSKEDGRGVWMTFYVVQEEDEIKIKEEDENGKEIFTPMMPGDVIRLTYENRCDPYDHSKIVFCYRPVVVAEIDEETGEITKKQPYFNQLVECATKKVPDDEIGVVNQNTVIVKPMSTHKRWDFQVKYISNTQRFYSSPEPPYGAAIENIRRSKPGKEQPAAVKN